MNSSGIKYMVEESLRVLSRARDRYRRVYVMFSGGRDSLVVLDLAAKVFRPGEMKIVFIEVTGNTAKCNIDFVYRVHRKYYSEYELMHLRRDIDFFEYMVRTGLPGLNARWCMRVFKLELLKKLMPPFFIVGVKRSDSRKRSIIYKSFFHRSEYTIGLSILPILNWTKREIHGYIKEYGLPLSPCYDRYGHSGNCMFCTYHNKKAITLTLQDPYWKNKIISALNKIYTKSRYAEKIKRQWLKNNAIVNESILKYSKVITCE